MYREYRDRQVPPLTRPYSLGRRNVSGPHPAQDLHIAIEGGKEREDMMVDCVSTWTAFHVRQ